MAESNIHEGMQMFGFEQEPEQKPQKPDETQQQQQQSDNVTISRDEWERMREDSKRAADLMTQILTGGQKQFEPIVPAAPKQPEINLDGLPNPQEDLQGFLTGFAARSSEAMKQIQDNLAQTHQNQQSLATQQQETLDRAWGMLNELAPELEEFPTIAKAAADEVADNYRRRGIDPLLALRQDMTGFVKNVADAARGTITRVLELQNGGEGDEPDGRTAMLGSRPTTPRRKEKEEKEISQFVDEIKATQKAMGLF